MQVSHDILPFVFNNNNKKKHVSPHDTLFLHILCKAQENGHKDKDKFMTEAASLEEGREMREGGDGSCLSVSFYEKYQERQIAAHFGQ